MKNKIYGLVGFLFLIFPVTVSAQWSLSGLQSKTKLPDKAITTIVGNFLLWLLSILGIIGIIGFVISGIMYLIAVGDQTMAERAKKGMTYSIIGVIVGLAGLVVITAINALFGGTIQI